MPRASMRLTGTAAGDLRRPWRASSAVSCESRGGLLSLPADPQPRGPASQVCWSPSFFFFFFGVGSMSEEWDKVKHEVHLMVGLLWAIRADLSAAENSDALTESQITFVKMVRAWSLAIAGRIEQSMTDATKDETAEEGEAG